MARIEGIGDKQANVFTRTVYGAVRRKIGRVPEPMRITAHQPRLLAALGGMEMAQEASHAGGTGGRFVQRHAGALRRTAVSGADLGHCVGKLPGALRSCFRVPGGGVFGSGVLSVAEVTPTSRRNRPGRRSGWRRAARYPPALGVRGGA